MKTKTGADIIELVGNHIWDPVRLHMGWLIETDRRVGIWLKITDRTPLRIGRFVDDQLRDSIKDAP